MDSTLFNIDGYDFVVRCWTRWRNEVNVLIQRYSTSLNKSRWAPLNDASQCFLHLHVFNFIAHKRIQHWSNLQWNWIEHLMAIKFRSPTSDVVNIINIDRDVKFNRVETGWIKMLHPFVQGLKSRSQLVYNCQYAVQYRLRLSWQ